MATTPFASRGNGNLTIRDGDTVAGDSATAGAGGNITIEGGDAAAATDTDGGDVILRPGLLDGTGGLGEVQVTNRTGTEDDAIIAFSSTSGNSHTIRWRVGTIQPNTDLVPASAGGDLYVQSDGTMWIASAAGTGNWSEIGAGGGTASRIATAGIPTEALRFFVDFNNQSSWEPNQTTTWLDTIDSVSGTTTNTSIVDGHLNFFTGSSSAKVDFGALTSPVANNFAGGGAIAFWIRVESVGEGSSGRIADTAQGASTTGYLCYTSDVSGSACRINFNTNFSGVNGEWETTAQDATFGEWVHVVIVYDADNVANDPTFYVNGVSVAVTQIATPTGTHGSDVGNNLVLGNRNANGRSFDGDIETFGIYDASPSAAEVTDLYETTKARFGRTLNYSTWPTSEGSSGQILSTDGAGTLTWENDGGAGIATAGVPTDTLQFFIDFNNQSSWEPNQATTWTDTIGSLAGTAANTTITDGHLNFNNSTSEVDFGVLPAALVDLFDGGGTMFAWIRPESDGEDNFGRIVDTSQSSTKGWAFTVSGESGGFVDLTLFQRLSTGFGQWDTTTAAVPLDEWTFVAVTFDASTPGTPPLIYIDGVSVAVTTTGFTTGTVVSDSGDDLMIGNRSSGTATFDGDIEVIGLSDSIFTVDEITAAYRVTGLRFGVAAPATLAEILAVGNATGGTSIIGDDEAATSGGALTMRGGATTAGSSADGGSVSITGGQTNATSGSGGGGDISIAGGIATGTSGHGGDVSIFGGTPTGTGFAHGGNITIGGGDKGAGTNGDAGDVTITGGDGGAGSFGGAVAISAGSTTGTAGGPVTITAGTANAGSNASGGDLTLSGGDAGEQGGDVIIKGGAKTIAFGTPRNSGNISIESGDIGTGNGYESGNISIIVPSVLTPASSASAGGNITITAGTTGTTNNDGGDVDITAGDTYGFNTRFGGSIRLTCGDDTNGSTSSEGGSVIMVPGTSVSGDDGLVQINGTGTLQLLERAAVVTGITGGLGRFWVRSDSPNVAMFTDDGGDDWVLNTAAGAADLQEAYEGGNAIVTDGANGAFSVTGTETITLQATGANASLSALNVSITSLGGATAGDVNLTGGAASGAGNPGGDIFLNPGDGNTTGAGGSITGTAGDGGTTGVGGPVSFTGGGGGATSGDGGGVSLTGGAPTDGDGGDIEINTGDGVGTNRNGGTLNISGGSPTGTGSGGIVNFSSGSGATTGSGGDLIISGGDGGSTSGPAGRVDLLGGDSVNSTAGNVTVAGGASTSSTGGHVNITAGDSGSSLGGEVRITAGSGSTPGEIDLQTDSLSTTAVAGEIKFGTQTSEFLGSERRLRTKGLRTTNNTVTTILTVGTLSTNLTNLKIEAWVTGTDATNNNMYSRTIRQTFWRNNAGTLAALTAHQNSVVSAGTVTGWNVTLVISGNNILLRVVGNTGVTVDWMAQSEVQLGGMVA